MNTIFINRIFVIAFLIGPKTLKQKIKWMDLIALPTRIRPTGPGGQGHGHGRGRAQLPNHHITSPETIKFVKEAKERSQKKEKIKKRRKFFCKKALLWKAKRDRLVKKLKLEGEL